ncbi:MAG: ribosomal subunit interface protein [Deltaproteobacteria bacterium RBG_13_43_22]|nr:MAG: ribosomal subunit interface protein [Deltaproteobacteria bacterium RBG_13_43_22]
MQISVSFRNVDPSDHLKGYAENRMARFKKYMEEPIEVHLVLSIQKFRHTADVTVSANGFKIKAQEETGDLYSAIDMVLDKIEKQIKRHREKVKEHKPEGNIKSQPEVKKSREDGETEEDTPQIVKTETVLAKPMDAEEASLQLKMSNNEFLVFTNSKTRLINVLYRRKDGNFGLIEPTS